MKPVFFFLAAILAIPVAPLRSQELPPYKNPSLPVESRVRDLLARMTVEEKFFQLFMIPGDLDNMLPGQYAHGIFGLQVSAGAKENGNTQQMLSYNTNEDALALTRKINTIQKYFVENTRLGIPIIPFDEALHGLVREGATAFPQAIALAATFDTSLVRQVASAIAMETKARGIRQVLGPVVNIATDVRWGRVEETYGEDPFLSSAMGVSYVKPFERNGIITTPKHFVANVGDGGRDSYPIHLSDRLLEEIHFPPFKACFTEGGSRSVMTSYNSLNGVPCTSNDWLLNQKLKSEWGFEGFVISDAGATGGSIVLHNTSPDFPIAAQQAIHGGLDVIFQTAYQHQELFAPAFYEGRIDQQVLDNAVSRVLKAKFDLGLFENPYTKEESIIHLSKDSTHKILARNASLASIVLLKNGHQTLPLKETIRSIAVIGQDAIEARLGGYSGPGNGKVNVLDGIRKRAGNSVKVNFAEGCKRLKEGWQIIPPEFLSGEIDGKLKGEYFDNLSLSGTPLVTRAEPNIDFLWTLYPPDQQLEKDFYSVRWTGKIRSPRAGKIKIGLDGNDGFRLYIDNKLLIDHWKKQSYTTKLVEFSFGKNTYHDLRIEFFEPRGNARIRLVWDLTPGEDEDEKKIREAVAITKKSDVAIIVAGIHEGEFQDRAILSLPGRQEELIRRVSASGKPVIVVLIGGSAITMNWLENVAGVLHAWYPGEEGGNAIAGVIFGDYNPAGRLPITFPLHEGQLPLVYNHKPTGRGDDYYNMTGLPLFPFGFGLSYTTFEYSSLVLEKDSISLGTSGRVSCTIRNTGTSSGDEVVQLYIRDILASAARPVMELKGFQRIHLKPGESKSVAFDISPDMLSMVDENLELIVEPGEFRIMIGSSSRDIRLIDTLSVTR